MTFQNSLNNSMTITHRNLQFGSFAQKCLANQQIYIVFLRSETVADSNVRVRLAYKISLFRVTFKNSPKIG